MDLIEGTSYAYDANDNMESGDGRAIGGSSFDKPSTITAGAEIATGVI